MPIYPISEEFLGQMASIPIRTSKPLALKELLFAKYKIEIRILPLNGNYLLRNPIDAYNSQKDLDVLYRALQDVLSTTDLLKS